jgi:hypothetical protein
MTVVLRSNASDSNSITVLGVRSDRIVRPRRAPDRCPMSGPCFAPTIVLTSLVVSSVTMDDQVCNVATLRNLGDRIRTRLLASSGQRTLGPLHRGFVRVFVRYRSTLSNGGSVSGFGVVGQYSYSAYGPSVDCPDRSENHGQSD